VSFARYLFVVGRLHVLEEVRKERWHKLYNHVRWQREREGWEFFMLEEMEPAPMNGAGKPGYDYCLHPEHKHKKPTTRGLCSGCYSTACKLISEKKVTWAGLEAAGKVLPPNIRKKKADSSASWLLGNDS
jgi:hypothetical protein